MTARIGLLSAQDERCEDFSRKVFHLHWVEDKTIGTEQNLMEALDSVGEKPTEVLERAQQQEIKDALRQANRTGKRNRVVWFVIIYYWVGVVLGR